MKLVHRVQWEGPDLTAVAADHPDARFVEARSQEEAVAELIDADILVIAGPYYDEKIAQAVNTAAPRLRWIQSSSIGTDKFEKHGVRDGIAFSNTAGFKGRTVAEHAIALMLAHVHAIPAIVDYKAQKVWARDALRTQVSSVEGKLMLLLGYGSVGFEVARKAKAFDMKVVAFNRRGEGQPAADEIVTFDALDAWLGQADFIVSTLPLSEETRHLLNADRLAKMKSEAVVLNVGRGEVVDSAALVRALAEGRMAAACLDVFEAEPLPPDSPLWTLPNVVLSPHVAGTDAAWGPRFAKFVSENLGRFAAGERLLNQQNLGRAG